MRRRDLFGRFAVIAAAVAVAPSVKAEAPPVIEPSLTFKPNLANGTYTLGDGSVHWAADGVAMGELRVMGTATFDGDIALTSSSPLTFEAMAADCAARGCRLKLHEPDDGWQLLTHYPDGLHTQANLEYLGGMSEVYARVDSWRRGLHGHANGCNGREYICALDWNPI